MSIARDGNDFTVAFQPENHVIFRHHGAISLRHVCRKLRWEIIEDKSIPDNLEDMRVSDRTGIGVRMTPSVKRPGQSLSPRARLITVCRMSSGMVVARKYFGRHVASRKSITAGQ